MPLTTISVGFGVWDLDPFRDRELHVVAIAERKIVSFLPSTCAR